ncbi:MAG: DUF6485 family protein [Desulfomonilia bacterium]
MDCIINKNIQSCRCTYESCSRRGQCCECVRYHRDKGQLPGCFFPKDIEKTYDRSIERFFKTYQERGKWW